MAKEIERKFLVAEGWQPEGQGDYIAQGYLSANETAAVRIRIRSGHGYLTVKSNVNGVTRLEYEYEVPLSDAEAMLKLCQEPIIEKHRYLLPAGNGRQWEIDVFHGDNEGLTVAEIELGSEEESFEKPEWLREEVSTDARYFNCNLAKNPYKNW
ncbi:MAG: CYTH domain-containing protein [Selenomonas sp.]|nr:CYTH domain-containing protein [Selenomonas sp.]